MVITMLRAKVPAERVGDLEHAYREGTAGNSADLPRARRH